MKALYIWQAKTWPAFTWDASAVLSLLGEVRHLEGRLEGVMGSLGFDTQARTSLDAMTEEVLRSSEIEGVLLDADRVRSSVAGHLGLDVGGLPPPDRYTEDVVQVMMDAVRRASEPLTSERLFGWHAALFPTGRSGMLPITVGAYRIGETPMQVVSGPIGGEHVHYVAPPSDVVPAQMEELLVWIESPSDIDPVLRAAIVHLWFVAIHPFDDGNGRLARTLTECLLARADGQPHRFYSLSAEILRHRKDYYEVLHAVTTGSGDITDWLVWFLTTLRAALERSESVIRAVLERNAFRQRLRGIALNVRQSRMLDRLCEGFEGHLTSSKWAKICRCSQATALRDITDLVGKGLLVPAEEGGRSAHYLLR